MTFINTNIQSFKTKYFAVCESIYSKDQLNKSIFNKIKFLSKLNLFLVGGKTTFLVGKNSTLQILIKNQVAYFGYLESQSKHELDEILSFSLEIVKTFGSLKVYCPVDISIWHGHRFKLNNWTNNQAIFSEPLGQEFYLDSLKKAGFNLATKYVTASSQNYKPYFKITENKLSNYDLSLYTTKELKLSNPLNIKYFLQIYNLSKSLFDDTEAFYPITFAAFLSIYLSPSKSRPSSRFVFALMYRRKLVGLIYFYLEKVGPDYCLTLKTLLVDKAHQGQGGYWILNQIFYKKAIQFGCQKVFFAYINSAIKAFDLLPEDSLVDRQYGLFFKNI